MATKQQPSNKNLSEILSQVKDYMPTPPEMARVLPHQTPREAAAAMIGVFLPRMNLGRVEMYVVTNRVAGGLREMSDQEIDGWMNEIGKCLKLYGYPKI